ncbi:MAG: lipase family protein [Actinomycetota bacterium]|nr:lipase family protein [Actinomycetota bacterium]
MRRTLSLFVAVAALAAMGLPGPAAGTTNSAGNTGPALQVSEAVLEEALSCPARFSGLRGEPVLFVHGSTLTSESNWSWNYGKVLPADGYDVCLVDLPDRARADMQVSTEYVVHAIRTMAERSGGRKIDVVGFSQGPIEPRWALKWWPEIRSLVDDVVAQAGVAHGFTETEGICAKSCIAPFWQMKPDSQFLAALNAGDETPGDVSYTSVYSRTDQFVWLAGGGNPWDESARLDGASNIAVQDLCPGRPVDHIQVVYDSIVHAVTMDALSNPGPADPSRIHRSLCSQAAMAGVSMADATRWTAQINYELFTLASEHHTEAEPALAAYARS